MRFSDSPKSKGTVTDWVKESGTAAVVVGAAVVAAEVTAADVAGAPGFVVATAVAAAVVTAPAALQVNLYDRKPGGGS